MKHLLALLSFLSLPLMPLFAAPPQHPDYEPTGKPCRPIDPNAQARGARLLPVSLRQRFDRDHLSGIAEAPTALNLRAWRGETVQAQVLVESPDGFHSLFATTKSGKGEVRPLRYTTGNGVLIPDIVDHFEGQVFPGVVRPLLISYTLPPDTAEPLHDTLIVSLNGSLLTLPVTVTPDAATLPPPSAWSFHLDLWQHPDAVARWHDVPMWSPEHLALLTPQMRTLADMGQKTITCTLVDEAWQAQTYDRFRSMITVIRKPDGSWDYDYTAFDTWVTFCRDTIGMTNATLNCYTLIPWSLTFTYTEEATHTVRALTLTPGTPDYEAYWGNFLTAFVAHLKSKGWLSVTRIAMDERPDALLKPALEVVRKYAPELKIVAACNQPSAINRDFQDVSYAYNHCERLLGELPERQAQGKTTTFYTCLFPPRPNTLMTSDLAEAEWMIPMVAHYGMDGMLRWAYHSWEANPFISMDHVRFPSGDTALTYPGDRSSMRLVLLRRGIQTFEKIRLLRAEATRQNRPEALAPLTAALDRFTVARGKEAGIHEADLIALDEALRLVTVTLYSTSL